MNFDDQATPVVTFTQQEIIDQLKVQLEEVRKDMEIWRSTIEAAKILAVSLKVNAGIFDSSIAYAVDDVFRAVEAAINITEGKDGRSIRSR